MTADTAQTAETAESMSAADVSMTVSEAAKELRRSPEYLRCGLREGRFPGSRLGRAYLMPRAFIQGFVRDVLSVGRPISFEEYATRWLANTDAEATV